MEVYTHTFGRIKNSINDSIKSSSTCLNFFYPKVCLFIPENNVPKTFNQKIVGSKKCWPQKLLSEKILVIKLDRKILVHKYFDRKKLVKINF